MLPDCLITQGRTGLSKRDQLQEQAFSQNKVEVTRYANSES